MEIDDELASFLHVGPFSIIIATCDPQLTPNAVRAWGPRIHDDGLAVELFVSREPARQLIQNVATNDAMAVAVANVTTYQALQLKGRCAEVGEADPEDQARVLAHGEAFVAGTKLVGVSEQAARGVVVSDVVRVRFVPETLYDQTPGPEAGTPR